ncbi:TetR/AcrR family transcriptional regulator [Rugosimonospora africana]|uniref:TetR family transcriptional regulator n=1 Tax=Rugosimonospora africana TaxID=556532 RepID=A0A8J3QUJ0_9ACTN|nr:TetR/AcrR family transcriptional regulator C-terminal domain-containing protein [Rugosimonospora africana]GIH15096.1 TetR family transcriptional regulator [Rugosimonospora africana]
MHEAEEARREPERQRRRRSPAAPGPVWARSEPRRDALNRAGIVAAASRIADAEGLGAVSIRRVASELGAGTMSLYTHVASKDDLLDLMFDELIGEARVTGPPQPDWRASLIAIARRKRALCLSHPWAVRLYGRRPLLGPNAMRLFEETLAAMHDLRTDPATAWQVICAVDDYTLGFVQRETVYGEAARQQGSALNDWEATIDPYLRQVTESEDFPLLRALRPVLGRTDERSFEQGLDWLLDGIEARLGSR